MVKPIPIIILILVSILTLCQESTGQEWKFVKERDGIRLYTRSEDSVSVKSFKGEAYFHSDMDKISHVLGNVEDFKWWDEDIREIKVLEYQPEKYIRYYLVYSAPWPFSDRDLCVEAQIINDSASGKRIIHAVPIEGLVPEYPDKVRIKNYWQDWTMEPAGDGLIHVTLEGSVDPGGYIPSWLINMVITNTPYNIMKKLREQVEN